MLKKLITVFLISSSLPVFLITMTYLGLAYEANGRPSNVPYELFPIFIPFLFGIFGVINYVIIQTQKSNNISILLGALFGFILSLIGNFGMNLPDILFKMKSSDIYTVHIYAPIIYALIFRFILTPLTNYVLK
jgi:hypothetical protein